MGNKKIKIVIFISGRGSNMESLIRACESDDFPAEVALVISNRPDAGGLKKARSAHIPTEIVDHKNFGSRETFEQALIEILAQYSFDVICLAGFMRILSPFFIQQFPKRIINIHPSLLPAYKGVNTHERVLADEKKETGCSVHYVTEDVDSGEILVQKKIDVIEGDTVETLSDRVLAQEHIAYPEAVCILAKILFDSENKAVRKGGNYD